MITGLEINDLRMTDAEFRMFVELLRKRCGLHFSADARFLLEKRIARRLRELDLTSFSAYHYQIRSRPTGDGEFDHLVDELTTNETYFFRERGQLRALVSEIIPEVLVRRRGSGGPVMIWSAGCSSGEEAYSIVMLAIEAGLTPGVDFRVYAADISRKILHKARQGVYREASFRETESVFRKKYFTEKEGGLSRISDDVKKHVDFIHLNLLDRSKIALVAAMDVILCRNVIIYFNSETKQEVIGSFYQKLRPGGYLLLGHAESLISLSSAFELRHLREDLVYRRPLPGMEGRDAWNEAASLAIGNVEREGGRP